MTDSHTSSSQPTKWDAIVVTCPKGWSLNLRNELEARRTKGYIHEDVIILVVEDPKSEVGSGGATINALLTVTEYISAVKGLSVVNPDVLLDCNILILHNGQTFTFEGCSRPFVTLPITRESPKFDSPVCNIDLMISIITEKLSVCAPKGVWVSSMDMVISVPESLDLSASFQNCDVCAFSIPLTPKLGRDHGVCVLNPEGFIDDIMFKPELSILELLARPDDNILGITGIVYMTHSVADKLLSFYTKPPLDACTYMGLDSGQLPLKLSLFYDFLLPMTHTVTEEDFVRGKRGGSYGKPSSEMAKSSRHDMEYARQLLWNNLHDLQLKACVIEGGKFVYMTDSAGEHKKLLLSCPETEGLGYNWTYKAHAFVSPNCEVSKETCLINSQLTGSVTIDSRCAVSHCKLGGTINVGKDSVLTGLDLESKLGKTLVLPESMVVQGFNIYVKTLGMSRKLYTVHGRHDNLMAPTWRSMSTFCNQPWLVVLQRTGILKEDLWGCEITNEEQTIVSAKLFPVFHMHHQVGLKEMMWLMGTYEDNDSKSMLKRWRESWRISMLDILTFIDVKEEFAWKKNVFYDIVALSLKQTLKVIGNQGFCSFYNSAHVDGFSAFLLDVLDNIANDTASPDIVARTLANISDVLGGMAGSKGGLRSGPAANIAWQKAFKCLEAGDIRKGLNLMAKERENWTERPDLLVRAARHYEGGAQIFIRHAVMTARKFFDLGKGVLPRTNKWIEANCPARCDISGGWSDTPPITYELGGAVTIVGLLLNGKKPIGAKARRIKEPVLRLVLTNPGAENTNTTLEITKMQGLETYNHPRAIGALVMACIVCIKLVDINSRISLKEQLVETYGGGFEIHSWSSLPQGSGMGTSSILAGALLAVILSAAGKTYTKEGLVHMVLCVEQLLTTGGGWQDQVGGLLGGVHLATSDAEMPLQVTMKKLTLSKEITDQLNKRLLLVYTGKTRLARNMLQDVVRNWYSRTPLILDTENSLVEIAKECAEVLQKGDFDAVSKCVKKYWELKKQMAPGSETITFLQIAKVLEPFISCMCCCGAGGGGFLFGILKEEGYRDTVKRVLAEEKTIDVEVYDSCIDEEGMVVTMED